MTTVALRDAAAVEAIRTALPDVVAVFRYGSTAAGVDRPDSDVDLAVLASAPVPALTRFDLQERLASLLRRPVDLVDLKTASTVMAMQVLANGLLLLDVAEEVRGEFEDRVFSAYASLNEERRGILERIAAEGSVYGG